MSTIPENGGDSQIIDLDIIAAKGQEDQAEALRLLREQFPENDALKRLLGDRVFGSETKTIIGPDGNEQSIPWTHQDFFEYWRAEAIEVEEESRKTLTLDLIYALDMQSMHFGNPEDESHAKTKEVVDACTALLERVLDSGDSLTEMWPWDIPEARRQACTLEVIRRMTLNSPYNMFGTGHDGDLGELDFYFDQWGERMKLYKEYETFLKSNGLERSSMAAKAFIENKVVGYGDEDWETILASQQSILFAYIKAFIKRSDEDFYAHATIGPRMLQGGKRIYTDQQIEGFGLKAEDIQQMSAITDQMDSFNDLLPQIKVWFGEKASFKDFFNALSHD